MRKILVILFWFTCLSIQATVYHVAASGGDYSTLAQVSAATFTGGDQILFNRGETFYGTLTIHNSGTFGNLITYGAYGTGADPIITGFTAVTTWTNLGSNIWESTSAVSTLTTCNLVRINGVNTPMGRIPNLGSYYTAQTHSGNASITSSDLSGTPNWTGAQVVIRKESWIWQIGLITSQSSGTVSYTDGGTFTPQNNWGFFIQNDARTLDTQNEWYYNPSTKKISIYSTSQPTNVKVTSLEYLISSTSKNYITISNLNLIGANTTSVYLSGGTYATISNCTINYSGLNGVHLYWPTYTTIDNNIIKNSSYAAVFGETHCDNATISNNTADSTTMIIGVGLLYAPAVFYFAGGNYVTVSGNKIDHSGYDGVLISKDFATVRNNFINHSVLNRSDGGGIYCGGTYTSLIIDGNIVLNSFGYTPATNGGGPEGNGIYLDAYPEYITVSNNTCAYNSISGIYLNLGATHNTISGNTCFGNAASQLRMETYVGGVVTNNNTVTNNKFIAKGASELITEFRSALDNIPAFFTTSDNNYFARPIDDTDGIRAGQPNTYGSDYMTLAQWKTFSSLDANSHNSLGGSVADTANLHLIYNNTSTIKYYTLSAGMVDVANTSYSGTTTLLPFTSRVLIGAGTVTVVPGITTGIRVLRNSGGKLMRSSSGKILIVTQ
jgi:parallel beta-helix repeat protein